MGFYHARVFITAHVKSFISLKIGQSLLIEMFEKFIRIPLSNHHTYMHFYIIFRILHSIVKIQNYLRILLYRSSLKVSILGAYLLFNELNEKILAIPFKICLRLRMRIITYMCYLSYCSSKFKPGLCVTFLFEAKHSARNVSNFTFNIDIITDSTKKSITGLIHKYQINDLDNNLLWIQTKSNEWRMMAFRNNLIN